VEYTLGETGCQTSLFSHLGLCMQYAVCAERGEGYTRGAVAPQLLADFGDINGGKVA
jgi:hypothetical protein